MGTGGGASFGGGGIFGIGGGATPGIFGIDREAICPALAAGAFPPSDSPCSDILGREMIWVYGLGPLGASTGTGTGSAAGRMNAPVAPSPGRDAGLGGIGFSAGALRGGRIAGAEGGVDVTTGVGVGATKTGSGKGVTFIAGADGGAGTAGGIMAPGTGGAALIG